MDWNYVVEELRDVPDEFKEQRFYPLKHVVDIFSSGDPQGRTAELRERESRLGELVDMVVENYHPGFARSIQNYSQILQLFQDSKEQVDSMRKSLTDAIRQLGAQSKHLNQEWLRNVSLQASLSLLKDVQGVLEIPAQIEAAVANKDWPTAVNQLLDGASRLAREELMKVGALRKLRGELYHIWRFILGQMCEELQARAYGHATGGLSMPATPGGPLRAGATGLRRQPRLRPPSAAAGAVKAAAGASSQAPPGLGREAGRTLQTEPVVVSTKQLVTCLAQLDGVEEAKAYLAFNCRAEVRRLMLSAVQRAGTAAAQSYHAVSRAMDTGHASISLAVPQHVEFLAQSLVQRVAESCLEVLASLGSVVNEIANAPLATTHSTALEMIRSQAEGAAAVQNGAASPKKALTKNFKQDRAKFVKQELMHVWLQMQEEWHLLLSQLLGSSLRALGARSVAAAKRGAAPPKGLAQPLGWLVRFDEFAEQVSSKVEAVLGGQGGQQGVGRGEGHSPGAGPQGTGHVPNTARPKAPPASRLHFQLEVKVKDLAPETVGLVAQGSQDPEAQAGYAKLVPLAIGERQGTTYLTPSIYLKLTHFVDAALGSMKEWGAEVEMGREPAKGRGRDKDSAALWLQEAAQDLVLEVFIPQVWMDMRARLTAAMEQPDAFRPPGTGLGGLLKAGPGHNMAGHAGLAAAGPKGVVAAARFAERMLRDMTGWSQAVPTFEMSFLGVAENLLSRMLDTFAVVMTSVAGASHAWRLALRQDIAHAQATEPDAVFLGDPNAFCVPRTSPSNPNPGGNTVASAAPALGDVDLSAFLVTLRTQDRPVLVQTHAGRSGIEAVVGAAPGVRSGRGLAAGGEAAELEVELLVFSERSQALLSGAGGGSARHVALASLAESLEFMADAVLRMCARQQGPGVPPGLPPRGNTLQQSKSFRATQHSKRDIARMIEDLPVGLPGLVQRCKALAGLCVRTLRLDLQLMLAQSLHSLGRASHLVEPGDEAREVHPAVANLTRVLSRTADDLLTQLAPSRAAYVLAGLAPSAARMCMWLLPEIREINALGVDRMVNALSVVQPSLLDLVPALASSAAHGSQEAEMRVARIKAFDRARAYCRLLLVPCDEVVRMATDHPMRYGYGEWLTLLMMRVPGRVVLESHVGALQTVLDRAHGLTAGQKIVTGLGSVLNTVIANPAEKVADVARDVLKAGGQTLVAGAMIPARQIGKVFRKLEGAVSKDKGRHHQGEN